MKRDTVAFVSGTGFLICLSLLIGFIRGYNYRDAAIESHEPWIVYRTGAQEATDREAIRDLLTDKLQCGYSTTNNAFTLYLGHQYATASRSNMLEVIAKIEARLPEGHPFTFHVQTLDETIEWKHDTIAKIKKEIEQLKSIHGEPDASL